MTKLCHRCYTFGLIGIPILVIILAVCRDCFRYFVSEKIPTLPFPPSHSLTPLSGRSSVGIKRKCRDCSTPATHGDIPIFYRHVLVRWEFRHRQTALHLRSRCRQAPCLRGVKNNYILSCLGPYRYNGIFAN